MARKIECPERFDCAHRGRESKGCPSTSLGTLNFVTAYGGQNWRNYPTQRLKDYTIEKLHNQYYFYTPFYVYFV
ncbi:MAG: hypothetical protein UX89_C0009G0022 [Parcubacteria group bacterium GW2011_GWA2_47_16]|nr:MAG: hypothetical protein UX89_C0009G0022 [Parcubacteria group bacterium GW2011_GWA2_47_16]